MPAHDLPLLIKAAQKAGQIAAGFTGPAAVKWEKPGGQGPVTEADLAVNTMLFAFLRDARPDYGWLSEETEDDTARLHTRRVFIIDPIDGTRSFIDGSKTWAHSLAVAEDGAVTAAVIYLPLRDKLYAAALGQGATLNGTPIAASVTDMQSKVSVLAAKPVFQPANWTSGAAPQVARAYRPSLAYRMALVAEGRFDAMITLRQTWEWDIAAGVLIAAEAGGKAKDRRGQDLSFNNRDPRLNGIIAGGPPVCTALLDALA
ncbi:MAG: 3'(2'),5'-bisphosphate nucleotidase CysQ [Pseudomonadota bacterium]